MTLTSATVRRLTDCNNWDTSWTTANRPSSPDHGVCGYNEDTRHLEVYDAITQEWNVQTQFASWYVDSVNGNDTTHSGRSFQSAYKTIAVAVAACAAGDSIYIKGSFNEAVTCAKIGVRIVGLGTGPHQATWTAAADAVCLTLTAADCEISGIRFQPPAYAAGTPAAILLSNAAYTRIIGNRFQGKTGSMYAIFCMLDATHSSDNVLISGNEFIYMNNITTVYGSCIAATEADGGYSCSSWKILGNIFNAPVEGINMNARGCLIAGNQFLVSGLKADGTMGAVTGSAGSKTMITLAGTNADCNHVRGNWLGGAYSSTLYVKGGTNDSWFGNWTLTVTATITNGAGMTLTATA